MLSKASGVQLLFSIPLKRKLIFREALGWPEKTKTRILTLCLAIHINYNIKYLSYRPQQQIGREIHPRTMFFPTRPSILCFSKTSESKFVRL